MMECETLEDFMAVLEEGLENRKVGGHAMNDHSSRSHTMLTIYIDSEIVSTRPVSLTRAVLSVQVHLLH